MENDRDIPVSRLMHCYGVGRKMYRYAKMVLGWPEEKAREMFVLGLLHDAGYEFDSDDYGHGDELAKTLERNSYKYASEIRNHNRLIKDPSDELVLLWYADQVIDGSGNKVSYDQRLSDIGNRHGFDSRTYRWMKEIIDYCREHGYRDDTE